MTASKKPVINTEGNREDTIQQLLNSDEPGMGIVARLLATDIERDISTFVSSEIATGSCPFEVGVALCNLFGNIMGEYVKGSDSMPRDAAQDILNELTHVVKQVADTNLDAALKRCGK